MRNPFPGASVALVFLITLSGCTRPSLPQADDWQDKPECPEKLTILNSKHQWSMVQDSVKDVQFKFANLTSIKFSLLTEAPVTTYFQAAPPATNLDWYLKDPHGVVVWDVRYFIDGGGPTYEYTWSAGNLHRMTGTWTLHLDGLGNAQGTIRMEGTIKPCAD